MNNKIHLAHAEHIKNQLKSNGIRVTVYSSNEKKGYKIRQSQIKKVPYTVVIGDNELREDSLSIRKHGEQDAQVLAVANFIEILIKDRRLLY